jgi:hypothetical protein
MDGTYRPYYAWEGWKMFRSSDEKTEGNGQHGRLMSRSVNNFEDIWFHGCCLVARLMTGPMVGSGEYCNLLSGASKARNLLKLSL